MTTHVAVLSLSLLWAAAPAAGETTPLTLADALRTALRHSSSARHEQLDHIVADAEWRASKAEFEPKLTLEGSTGRSRFRSRTRDEEDTARQLGSDAELGATWKLPIGTQIHASLRAGRQRSGTDKAERPRSRIIEIVQPLWQGAWRAAGLPLEQARLARYMAQVQRSQALDAIVVTVSLAYFDAVQAQEQVRLARQALERATQSKSVNEALHEAGQLAKVDLLQSDADVAQAELALEQARNTRLSGGTALLQLLGPEMAQRDAGELDLSHAPPPWLPSEPQDGVLLAQALAQRPDLQFAKALVASTQVSVAQALDEGRPALDLVFGVASAKSGASHDASTDRSVQVRWNIPLDRSLLRLQRTHAQVASQRAELSLQDAQLQVRAEVSAALRELDFARRQAAMTADMVHVQRRKLQAESERLRAGKTSAFQLSAAQDELRAAEGAQLEAEVAIQRTRMQLAQTTGSLPALRQTVLRPGGPE